MHTMVSNRIARNAAILGGSLWVFLWSLHTIAHGPKNPAPPDGMVLGYTAFTYRRIMMVVAPVPLFVFLVALMTDAVRRRHHGIVVGAILCGIGFSLIFLVGIGIAAWVLYALGCVLVYVGLLIIGVTRWYIKTAPRMSWIVPLAMGLLIPCFELARTPSSPLLHLGDLVGYVLLESLGMAFGLGWIALGLMFTGATPAGEQNIAPDARERGEN